MIGFRAGVCSIELIERGAAQTLTLRPHESGRSVTPTAATVTITAANGTAVVTAGVCTCANGAATYALAAPLTTGYPLEDGWQVTWSATIDGASYLHRTDAALVRSRLHPVISEPDLYARVPALSPAGRAAISARQEYSTELADAWTTIQERLLLVGRRPWLVVSPGALREAHVLLTLARILTGLANPNTPFYAEQGRLFSAEFEAEWRRIQLALTWDESDRGAPPRSQGATTTLWLGSPR